MTSRAITTQLHSTDIVLNSVHSARSTPSSLLSVISLLEILERKSGKPSICGSIGDEEEPMFTSRPLLRENRLHSAPDHEQGAVMRPDKFSSDRLGIPMRQPCNTHGDPQPT